VMNEAAMQKTSGAYIPPEKYPAIHDAVLTACDGLDGVKDGVLENPLACRFDAKALQCKPGEDTVACLTPAQVQTANMIYADAKDPKTGKVLTGGLLRGTELQWGTLYSPAGYGNAIEAMKYIAMKDASWDAAGFNAATDIERAQKGDADGILKSDNPNMVGKSAEGKSIELFMVPGMLHCQGGPGTDTWDKASVIDAWVTTGKAPDRVVASHLTDGKADRTRPLCVFPKVAKWNGTGSTDDAANFTCVADTAVKATR